MDKKKTKPIDYRTYTLSKEEKLVCFVEGLLILGSILWIFYQNIFMVILFSPSIILYIKYQKNIKCKKRKWELTLQFKEGVQALVTALATGYALENAFVQAIKDLQLLYNDEDMIIKEYKHIVYQMKMNIPVEIAIREFALRSGVEDIENLSEVLVAAKKTGGDLIRILKSTGKIIADKIEVTKEINILMSGKRLEAKVMSIIPIGIILYMKVSSPGFLNPLYGNIIGISIMTIALIIYFLSYVLMMRIVSIEI